MSLKKEEYEFLIGCPNHGASVGEYCYEQGYYRGFYPNGTPNLTHKGMDAIKEYQAQESYRWDVI